MLDNNSTLNAMNANHKPTNLFLRSLEFLEFGQFHLVLPNGKTYQFEGNKPGPKAELILHDYAVITNMALRGDIAFAEDYQAGKWDSPDIAQLVECGILNYDHIKRYICGSKIQQFLVNLFYLFKSNTKNGSRRNIHAHYDLGNAFYKLWLDETMTYSSALFVDKSETLAAAQHNKYDRILNQLADTPQRILEIGCGWGGFAERSIQKRDHHVTGLTISDEQFAFAKQRVQTLKANHHDVAKQQQASDIVFQDYRDVKGKFDAIVSIEMFEAVGERYWKTYFKKVQSLLANKGKAVIQTITIDDEHFDAYRKGGDAIRSYIFPGGMLPSPAKFKAVAEQCGLKVGMPFFFGRDYAKTLLMWLDNFDACKSEVQSLGFDESFIRLWRFYLGYCAGGFNAERINVMQIELQKAQ